MLFAGGRGKNQLVFPVVSIIKNLQNRGNFQPFHYLHQMAPTAPILPIPKLPSRSIGRPGFCLALSLLLCGPTLRAADPVVEVSSQNGSQAEAANSADAGAPLPDADTKVDSLFPVLISLGARLGYDSNSRTTGNTQGSAFSSQEITLSYDRLRGATQIGLLAGAGVVERFTQKTDVNAFLNLSVSHRVSQRLSLSANVDTAYRVEPDFSTDVGPNQRAGNYFRTADSLAASYQWNRRFSTVTSASFRLIRYEDNFVAAFTDRNEYTLGEEFRFDFSRQTVLVANYRFLIVDYLSFPRDSLTHVALFGVEETFGPRLTAQARAGASFRSFDQGENRMDPHFEGSLTYAVARRSMLSWTTRYSVEEPAVREAQSRTTFRTGLQLTYGFTAKLSSALSLFYHHDNNTTTSAGVTSGPATTTDAIDVGLFTRYQISRHVDLSASIQHSEVSSSSASSDYSRNSFSLGMNFTF